MWVFHYYYKASAVSCAQGKYGEDDTAYIFFVHIEIYRYKLDLKHKIIRDISLGKDKWENSTQGGILPQPREISYIVIVGCHQSLGRSITQFSGRVAHLLFQVYACIKY